LVCSNLNVYNNPLVQLDFVPDEIYFVDLTLAGDQVKIQRWLLLTIPLSLTTRASSLKFFTLILLRQRVSKYA
jgi:hypothetical protein